MTDQQHPITPPPELIEDWIEIAKPLPHLPPNPGEFATLAARWGSDQELEACCEWLRSSLPGYDKHYADYLHTARRPKPPSLAEEALIGLERTVIMLIPVTGRKKIERFDIIRRALERLKELEALDD